MADDQTTNQNDASQNANDGGQQSSGARTFTQEELNTILTERLNRAKGTAVGDLLKELGFEKPEDLKTAVQRQREAENANKSELQKAQEQLAEYQKREQAWQAQQRQQALQIAVQGAAAKLGIVDAEVAMMLIREGVEFDAQGQPVDVEKRLTDLVNAKPFLLRSGASGSATNPARSGGSTTDDPFTEALYRGAGLKG